MAIFLSALIIGLSVGTIYGLAAFGMVMSYRISKVVNLGQAGISALCATMYWWIADQWGAPLLVSLALALILGTLMGAAFGYAVLRMTSWPKPLLMIVSLAVTLVLFAVADRFLPDFNPNAPSPFGDGGFNFLLTYVTSAQIGTFLVCIAVVVFTTWVVRKLRFGLFVRGVFDDPDGASTLGIPLDGYVVSVWAIAGAMAALAGVLATNRTSLDINLLMFVMVWGLAGAVLGGMESFALAFLGGLSLGTAQGVVGGTFGGVLPPGIENLSAIVVMAAGVLYAGTKRRHLATLQT